MKSSGIFFFFNSFFSFFLFVLFFFYFVSFIFSPSLLSLLFLRYTSFIVSQCMQSKQFYIILCLLRFLSWTHFCYALSIASLSLASGLIVPWNAPLSLRKNPLRTPSNLAFSKTTGPPSFPFSRCCLQSSCVPVYELFKLVL